MNYLKESLGNIQGKTQKNIIEEKMTVIYCVQAGITVKDCFLWKQKMAEPAM